MIHHQLRADGHHQVDGFEHQRQAKDFAERPLKTVYAANQRAQVNAVADAVGGEGAAGPGLKRHAGKTVRQFRQADGPAPARRIMQHRAVPLDTDQHHEMVELPVQNTGEFQRAELVNIK